MCMIADKELTRPAQLRQCATRLPSAAERTRCTARRRVCRSSCCMAGQLVPGACMAANPTQHSITQHGTTQHDTAHHSAPPARGLPALRGVRCGCAQAQTAQHPAGRGTCSVCPGRARAVRQPPWHGSMAQGTRHSACSLARWGCVQHVWDSGISCHGRSARCCCAEPTSRPGPAQPATRTNRRHPSCAAAGLQSGQLRCMGVVAPAPAPTQQHSLSGCLLPCGSDLHLTQPLHTRSHLSLHQAIALLQGQQ